MQGGGFPLCFIYLFMKWTEEQIPSQEGRIIVVTGANSGLGYYTTRALARKGARVIMACRSQERGEEARKKIISQGALVEPELEELDLASLESVHAFAGRLSETGRIPHVLVNNAGLMAIPYDKTRDGFEMQFGVNHLAHFALTALLWPGMKSLEGARIVQVSSLAHRWGTIRYEDPHWDLDYKKWGAYGMSKLANLLFTYELSRRLEDSGAGCRVVAAHPGYADTSLQAKSMRMAGSEGKAGLFTLVNRLVAQPGSADEARSGAFYGPSGMLRLHGWPREELPHGKRVNATDASRLWELSEKLTGMVLVP